MLWRHVSDAAAPEVCADAGRRVEQLPVIPPVGLRVIHACLGQPLAQGTCQGGR